MTTSLANGTNELRRICELPTGSALPRAARFLADLVQHPAFLGSQVLPLLEEAEVARGWYVADRFDAHDGAYSLQVFVWPSGTETEIHDHSSWGAYACAFGTVLEERYDRLDDGSRTRSRPPEEGLAAVVEPRGRGLDRAAWRRWHPQGRKSGRESGDLGPPLRAADRRGRRAGLRPLPRLRLRPAGFCRDEGGRL